MELKYTYAVIMQALTVTPATNCPTPDFAQHVTLSYNKRVEEMDSKLCRLALFLDPRFKHAANTQGKLPELFVEVRAHFADGGGMHCWLCCCSIQQSLCCGVLADDVSPSCDDCVCCYFTRTRCVCCAHRQLPSCRSVAMARRHAAAWLHTCSYTWQVRRRTTWRQAAMASS